MSRFKVYFPPVNEKEITPDDLLKKLGVHETLIAAYCSISGNDYPSLVPNNKALSVLGTPICFLEREAVVTLEDAMKLSEISAALHRYPPDAKINVF